MIDNIYVFDDIIEKPYQELIKETLIGGDKPPTVDKVEDSFPWYYTSDITNDSHQESWFSVHTKNAGAAALSANPLSNPVGRSSQRDGSTGHRQTQDRFSADVFVCR